MKEKKNYILEMHMIWKCRTRPPVTSWRIRGDFKAEWQ